MKLFLPPEGLDLEDGGNLSKDKTFISGQDAEAHTLAFLCDRGVTAKAYGPVVRALKRLHREGALDDRIQKLKVL